MSTKDKKGNSTIWIRPIMNAPTVHCSVCEAVRCREKSWMRFCRNRMKQRGERAKQPWKLFTDRSVRWQLITVAILSSAMQLCGNHSIYFYASSYVFQEAGISAGQIQYVTTGTGMCEFTACILCNLLIERLGRRLVLMGGYVFMTGWAIVFAVALSLESGLGQYCFVPFGALPCTGEEGYRRNTSSVPTRGNLSLHYLIEC